MGEAIVFTSGKGGVGKTTTIANIGTGLSQLEKKVVMLDTDMGLRNLDVVMGMEDRINYNLLDLLEHKCRLNQALIKDKRYPELYMIPASLTCGQLKKYEKRMAELIHSLKQEFDFCLIDCPAGIEEGFQFAISAADRAVIVTTPHISAVRDAGRVIALLGANRFLQMDLVVNEVNERMIRKHNMLSVRDIEELLGISCIGTIPSDDKVIISQNQGVPVISMNSRAGRYYRRLAKRINIGKIIPVDLEEEQPIKKAASFLHRKEPDYEIS